MGELVYKEWLPLSEANPSEMQVVRHKDDPNYISSVRYDATSGKWHDKISYIREDSEGEFEFLCLTPVPTEE